MILPLLSAYFLFAWVTSYHSDQKVEEYTDVYVEIHEISNILNEPPLYDPSISKEDVEKLVNDELSISLYNEEGMILYSSNPNLDQKISRSVLYKDLYDIKEGLRAFTYKEPVFEDGQLIGFFTIEIAREELMATIKKRGWIVTGLFVASFVLIYITIAAIVNKRLNKRLYGL